MTETPGRSCPYYAVIDEVLALAGRADADDDSDSRAVAMVAQLRAIAFVNRFHMADRMVPRPSIRPSTNGAVAFRWVARARVVEIAFQAAGGRYSVFDVRTNETMVEGLLDQVDPLHDVVTPWVLGRRGAEPAYADVG
jgi:hypothetical protein